MRKLLTPELRDWLDLGTIVVWFSCGAASAVAAHETIRRYGDLYKIRVVNNPVKEEHADNLRFLLDVQEWLGVEIESAVNPKFPDGSCQSVWEKRRYMSGIAGAPCTVELKKRARQHWEASNPHDWIVLGFTADERARHERFTETERENVLPVLIDAGITKADCFRVLLDAGLRLPEIYRKGFPNANCVGCVKATSPTYWNNVREHFPDAFNARAELSREVGARLVRYRGERLFLDELPPDAMGRPLKDTLSDVECGIFCEERQGSLVFGGKE